MTAGEEDAMMEQHFFNLHDISQGISRTLADGVDTRIFPGENVMLSVLRIGPNRSGEIWTVLPPLQPHHPKSDRLLVSGTQSQS
jgi:hypothetical protein